MNKGKSAANNWVSRLVEVVVDGSLSSTVAAEHLDSLLAWLAGRAGPVSDLFDQEFSVRGLGQEEAKMLLLSVLDEYLFDEDEREPYAVLGLPSDCSSDQVRRRYRRLIQVYHPDRAVVHGDWLNDRAETLNLAYSRLRSRGDSIPQSNGFAVHVGSSGKSEERIVPASYPQKDRLHLRRSLGPAKKVQHRVLALLTALSLLILGALYLSARNDTVLGTAGTVSGESVPEEPIAVAPATDNRSGEAQDAAEAEREEPRAEAREPEVPDLDAVLPQTTEGQGKMANTSTPPSAAEEKKPALFAPGGKPKISDMVLEIPQPKAEPIVKEEAAAIEAPAGEPNTSPARAGPALEERAAASPEISATDASGEVASTPARVQPSESETADQHDVRPVAKTNEKQFLQSRNNETKPAEPQNPARVEVKDAHVVERAPRQAERKTAKRSEIKTDNPLVIPSHVAASAVNNGKSFSGTGGRPQTEKHAERASTGTKSGKAVSVNPFWQPAGKTEKKKAGIFARRMAVNSLKKYVEGIEKGDAESIASALSGAIIVNGRTTPRSKYISEYESLIRQTVSRNYQLKIKKVFDLENKTLEVVGIADMRYVYNGSPPWSYQGPISFLLKKSGLHAQIVQIHHK